MNDVEEKLAIFRSVLLEWWRDGGSRQFAWRIDANRTGYRTLIAELMLRRTRAEQVEPVYLDFLARYPELHLACEANPDDIRRIMAPLGLKWRTDGLIASLAVLRTAEDPAIGLSLDTLRSLPGVGDYVSNAIICFASRDPSATLIDTNVVRS